MNEQFAELTTSFTNLTASYLQHTGDFEQPTSEYFVDKLTNYENLVNNVFEFKSSSIKYDLIA